MQRHQDNIFDKYAKELLENASVNPPPFLWKAIESKLPSQKPWYSKYKYFLLLLLLTATSTTSILIYKKLGSNYGNKFSTEVVKQTTGYNKNEGNTSTSPPDSKPRIESIDKSGNTLLQNKNIKPSVSSFYEKDKNGNENTMSKLKRDAELTITKKEERFKRLQVESLSTTTENKDERTLISVNQNMDNSQIGTMQSIYVKELDKANQSTNQQVNSEALINAAVSPIVSDAAGQNSTEATNLVIPNMVDDVTVPINEPLNSNGKEPLTASVVPVKVNQTPILSREVMRSLIEPEKLEKLDLETQAAGINDLNPNREKILKNLKQFAGYDINKGFHIGAFIGINNVWLNKKQYSADENTTSIQPKFQLGKAYGINIGYDYTDRWGIELEWQISEQGQKYSVKQNNQGNNNAIKEINLMYTKFPLMMKYKQMFINNYNSKPIALSFLFGPQFGFLIKKQVLLNGEKQQNIPEYNKVEFGLLGGFDFDLFMTRNMALTIGGRTGFGTSMRKGQPMSFQLGITTQLNFRFPKKIK